MIFKILRKMNSNYDDITIFRPSLFAWPFQETGGFLNSEWIPFPSFLLSIFYISRWKGLIFKKIDFLKKRDILENKL